MSNSLWPPWAAVHEVSLSFIISWSLLKFISTESVMLSNHLIFCCPLILLPSIFPSIRVFSNESALHIRQPKDWSFSFSFSCSNEYSGLISFRIKLVWSCSPMDSQKKKKKKKESSLVPQFKRINSSGLNFLYGPNLTSVPDYGKNHSFDYVDFCQQSDLCFLIPCLGWS